MLLSMLHAQAQAPQRLSYQSVVRDDIGQLVVSQPVGMRLSVLQGSDTGPAAYVETHATTTNANALVTLEIGGGAVVSGSMEDIDWAGGPWFLRTEIDPDGGTSYSITGSSQLLSVPYALFAANSEAGPQGPQGPPGTSDCPIIRTADGRAVVYTATTAHGLGLASTGGTQWYTTTLDGPVLGSIASDSAVVLYTAGTAYGFALSSTGGSFWTSTSISGTPVGALAASSRIVVYTGTQAYGLGRASTGSTNWSTTNINGPVVDHVVAGNRIILYSATNAYGYAQNATGGSAWFPTALASPPLGGEGTR
jgi:hypothetical protein